MRFWNPTQYRSLGLQEGLPPKILEEALSSAKQLERSGRSPLLTLGHLAKESQTRYRFLRQVVDRTVMPYSFFSIEKRSGGKRELLNPSPQLKSVQRWINRNVLQQGDVSIHKASVAYMPGCSIVDAARVHCGCRWLVKIDLRDFFSSINEVAVYKIFRSFGYRSLMSFELARLCTFSSVQFDLLDPCFKWGAETEYSSASDFYLGDGDEADSLARGIAEEGSERLSSEKIYRDRELGYLPQGAPTSPALSNMAMFELDTELFKLASSVGFSYTRYADDMIMSSSSILARRDILFLLARCRDALRRHRFTENANKTRVAGPGARKLAYGLLVDSETPRLPRDFRVELENEVYAVEKFGVQKHLEHLERVRGIAINRYYFESRLVGRIRFAHSVDPLFAGPLAKAIRAKVDW